MGKKQYYLVKIIANLFLGFSGWSTRSTPLWTLIDRSMLFLDFSLLSLLVLDFSLRSVLSLGFSLWSVLGRDLSSLWSVLDLDFSLQSVLFLGFSSWSVIGPDPFLRCGDFSMADMNFLRCFMYCGKSSKSQWFPPLIHNGSYFSLQSCQSFLPWDQSTTSSAVPCKKGQTQSTTAW